jgi:hypothetical protein
MRKFIFVIILFISLLNAHFSLLAQDECKRISFLNKWIRFSNSGAPYGTFTFISSGYNISVGGFVNDADKQPLYRIVMGEYNNTKLNIYVKGQRSPLCSYNFKITDNIMQWGVDFNYYNHGSIRFYKKDKMLFDCIIPKTYTDTPSYISFLSNNPTVRICSVLANYGFREDFTFARSNK